MASLDSPLKSRQQFHLKEGQGRLFHKLPSGLNMEVILQRGFREQRSEPEALKPPLVFVHGSFHAAWCWAEHWLPFFSRIGYDCYAVSLLGQGESDVPTGKRPGTLQTHTRDVANFIQEVVQLPAVLVGHSFGGLVVQSYISNMSPRSMNSNSDAGGDILHPKLAAAVLMCSVPPSGNSGLIMRYIFSRLVAAFKVTMSLAAKAFATSLSLCKETFFSNDMDDHQVQQYQELMRESLKIPLFDLKQLNSSLPVASVPKDFLEVQVLVVSDDLIVDDGGMKETAKFYGVDPVLVEGLAHDMMLDSAWEKAAMVILSWHTMRISWIRVCVCV